MLGNLVNNELERMWTGAVLTQIHSVPG
jgi:hypothetical protein